jgi:hypothetical protein
MTTEGKKIPQALRSMPARYLEKAPEIVRGEIIDLIAVRPAAPVGYSPPHFDVILRPEPDAVDIVGVDFSVYGARGCHFFLNRHDARAYRERNRRKRVAWNDLPELTKAAVLAYLKVESEGRE